MNLQIHQSLQQQRNLVYLTKSKVLLNQVYLLMYYYHLLMYVNYLQHNMYHKEQNHLNSTTRYPVYQYQQLIHQSIDKLYQPPILRYELLLAQYYHQDLPKQHELVQLQKIRFLLNLYRLR